MGIRRRERKREEAKLPVFAEGLGEVSVRVIQQVLLSDTEPCLLGFQAEDVVEHGVHNPALNVATVIAAFGNTRSPSAK